MGWHRTGLIAMLALGCTSVGEDAGRAIPLDETNDLESAVDPDSPFDVDGRLRASDQRVAGFTLPRGLSPIDLERPREHHYLAPEVEIDALVAYLGPRLVTGAVDRIGGGAAFRDAVPRGVTGGVVHLDVTAHPSPRGGSRLTIVELPPPQADRAPGQLDTARVRTAEQALRNLE